MAFQARADSQNQAIGWLRKECSSLGGGKAIQILRMWMASGECRLKIEEQAEEDIEENPDIF